MKQQIISALVAILLCAPAAMATTMSSPKFTSNAGRIVSGGTSASDASGMSKTGIAIGQGVFMPPGGGSNPGYSGKPTVLAALAAAVPVQLSTLPDGATSGNLPWRPVHESAFYCGGRHNGNAWRHCCAEQHLSAL